MNFDLGDLDTLEMTSIEDEIAINVNKSNIKTFEDLMLTQIRNFIQDRICTNNNANTPISTNEQIIIDTLNSDQGYLYDGIIQVVNKNELAKFINNAIKYFGQNGNYNWIDVSNMTSLTNLFANKTQFNGNISRWNVSNIENLNYTFQGCINFRCDLSGWDTSKVKWMMHCFYECPYSWDLKPIIEKNWNLKNVKIPKGMIFSTPRRK